MTIYNTRNKLLWPLKKKTVAYDFGIGMTTSLLTEMNNADNQIHERSESEET